MRLSHPKRLRLPWIWGCDFLDFIRYLLGIHQPKLGIWPMKHGCGSAWEKKSESNIVFVFSHVFPISNLLGNKFVYTYTFLQTVCPHWGVLTVDVRCKRPGLDQGAPSGPRLLNCKFSHTSSLVGCSRALRLRRLAQNGCPVLLLSEGRFTSMPC